jgi:hypothetical protein
MNGKEWAEAQAIRDARQAARLLERVRSTAGTMRSVMKLLTYDQTSQEDPMVREAIVSLRVEINFADNAVRETERENNEAAVGRP